MKVKKLLVNEYNDILINNHKISRLCVNSKIVVNNSVFYAILGETEDGHKYITEAVNKGAKTIITENFNIERIKGINYFFTDNIRKKIAQDIKIFTNNLLSKVSIIGVTGTNGKTTTTTLLYNYLRFLKQKVTLIGTNGIYIDDEFENTDNTTPDITEIYRIVDKSIKKKIKYVIMEVSSQAIKMFRVYGINFKIVALTNISHDHLDYHKSILEYMYTKGLFLTNSKKILLNNDILEYNFFNNLIDENKIVYGVNENKINKIYKISDISLHEDYSEFRIELTNKKNIFIHTNLLSLYNIYNITLSIALLFELGLYKDKVLEYFKNDIFISGRMETFKYKNRKIIVDYAHSPDSIEKTLLFLKNIKKNKLITVVGAGGNRDKTKRPIIGGITSKLSDMVIITTDNSRDENPKKITDNIVKGCNYTNFHVILDRKKAIKSAIDMSQEGDIIAILGRGNEKYMIEGKNKILLNDIDEVKKIIKGDEYY